MDKESRVSPTQSLIYNRRKRWWWESIKSSDLPWSVMVRARKKTAIIITIEAQSKCRHMINCRRPKDSACEDSDQRVRLKFLRWMNEWASRRMWQVFRSVACQCLRIYLFFLRRVTATKSSTLNEPSCVDDAIFWTLFSWVNLDKKNQEEEERCHSKD